MNFERLERKVGFYWLLTRSILLIFVAGGFVAGVIFIPEGYKMVMIVPGGILLALVVFYSVVLSFWDRKVYQYAVGEDRIVTSEGVLFRQYTVIPVVQIQDISLLQGPIQMAFSISTVVIATAGSIKTIQCISKEKAKAIVEDIQKKIHNRLSEKREEKENAPLH